MGKRTAKKQEIVMKGDGYKVINCRHHCHRHIFSEGSPGYIGCVNCGGELVIDGDKKPLLDLIKEAQEKELE